MSVRLLTRAIVPALLLALASGGGASAGDAGAVRAELLVDRAEIAPGASFQVGVRLTIAPGWHVYWKNPGDSGIATAVRFQAPPGFAVGPLRWPVPERFQQSGDEVAFGYEKEVLLSAEVRAPAAIAAPVSISAVAEWLCCSDVCVSGKASLSVSVPGSKAAPDAFAALSCALPAEKQPGVEIRDALVLSDHPGTGFCQIVLHWTEVPSAIECFPAPEDAIEVGHATCTTSGLDTRITMSAKRRAGFPVPTKTLDCVIAYTTKSGERRGLSVALPLGSP